MEEVIDWAGLLHKEAVQKAMELFNFTRSEAEFYVAMATGKVDGDVVEIVEGAPVSQ